MTESLTFPTRRGSRPQTTIVNPHQQLEQQPGDIRFREALDAALKQLPDVTWTHSRISVPGAVALTLSPSDATGPDEAFMVGTEFAHLHPHPDYSLHVTLPDDVARAAIDTGWVEQHPMARRGELPFGHVMVYAPRDDTEVDVVTQLVHISYDYARGPR